MIQEVSLSQFIQPTSLLTRRTSRRTLLRGLGISAAAITGAILIGCSDDDEEMDEAMNDEPMDDESPDDESMDDESMDDSMSEAMDAALGDATHYELVNGWYRDEPVVYYDFGTHSPQMNVADVAVAPIWAFITGMDADGNPEFVPHQHNIIDVVPGDGGYSDLWQVNLVTVPEDYVADSITSKADLDAMSYPTVQPGLFVNCPVVPAGSTLENGEELTQGWHNGERVYYPDFGANPPAGIPIWAFITGLDDDGNPQFVDGQHNVIDAIPSDPGYSAFWIVNLVVVDEGYEANSIKSAGAVAESGYEVLTPGLMVNCPVVEMM